MTTVWKSQPKKFCELCKCWFSDNPNSVQIHERGKNHQDNVKMKICEVGKKSMMQEKQLRDYEKCMLQIEKAALKSHKADDEEGLTPEEGLTLDEKSKGVKREIKGEINSNKKVKIASKKAPKVIMNSQEIGKWTQVKRSQDTQCHQPVDLQLPTISNKKTYKTPTEVLNDAYEINIKPLEELEFKEKIHDEGIIGGDSRLQTNNTFLKKKKFNKTIRIPQDE